MPETHLTSARYETQIYNEKQTLMPSDFDGGQLAMLCDAETFEPLRPASAREVVLSAKSARADRLGLGLIQVEGRDCYVL